MLKRGMLFAGLHVRIPMEVQTRKKIFPPR